jgi:hypothetical protein
MISETNNIKHLTNQHHPAPNVCGISPLKIKVIAANENGIVKIKMSISIHFNFLVINGIIMEITNVTNNGINMSALNFRLDERILIPLGNLVVSCA